MTETLRDYLDFAIDTAWQAGQLTLGYFQTGIRPDFKADESPVTVADREAEKLIRRRIEQRFPTHVVIGEEFGGKELLAESGGPSHRWIVDPIDGTRSFVRGVPLYGVLIALEIEGKCQVGGAPPRTRSPGVPGTVRRCGTGAGRRGFPRPCACCRPERRSPALHCPTPRR